MIFVEFDLQANCIIWNWKWGWFT